MFISIAVVIIVIIIIIMICTSSSSSSSSSSSISQGATSIQRVSEISIWKKWSDAGALNFEGDSELETSHDPGYSLQGVQWEGGAVDWGSII